MLLLILVLALLVTSCGKNPLLSILPEAASPSGGAVTTPIGGTINIPVTAPFSYFKSSSTTLTIAYGTKPNIAWSYVGLSGYVINIYVTTTTNTYWRSWNGSATYTSTPYGVETPGSENSKNLAYAPRSLDRGTYKIEIRLLQADAFHINGNGVGTLYVE